ncbi:hypothetical protein [Streptomyces sp. NPDC054866]
MSVRDRARGRVRQAWVSDALLAVVVGLIAAGLGGLGRLGGRGGLG